MVMRLHPPSLPGQFVHTESSQFCWKDISDRGIRGEAWSSPYPLITSYTVTKKLIKNKILVFSSVLEALTANAETYRHGWTVQKADGSHQILNMLYPSLTQLYFGTQFICAVFNDQLQLRSRGNMSYAWTWHTLLSTEYSVSLAGLDEITFSLRQGWAEGAQGVFRMASIEVI